MNTAIVAYLGRYASIIGPIISLVLYFSFAPMVNDDTCRALAEGSTSTLNRIVGELFVLCWVPWD